MVKQHSGVIMGITAVVSQIPFPYTAGFAPHGQQLKRCFACWQQNWGHMAFVPSACIRLVRKERQTRHSPPLPIPKWVSASKDGVNVGQAVISWARPLLWKRLVIWRSYGIRFSGRNDGDYRKPERWHDKSLESQLACPLHPSGLQKFGIGSQAPAGTPALVLRQIASSPTVRRWITPSS